MSTVRDAAVEKLIELLKAANKGTSSYLAIVEALGEAGGEEALAALLDALGSTNPGTSSSKAIIRALGRVGHTGE
ncbi:hypothetical protein [Hydrocarboniphaga effusa]|uniref:hypothetical protein n=1 Tax=Hydrocarboniphaga effusa TaxID=243629 RepID=UPI003BA9B4FE